MIKYTKNKNFISEKFYNRIEQKQIKKYNRLLILFLSINIFLTPISLKYLKEVNLKNEPIDNKISMLSGTENKINIQEVKTWVEKTMIEYVDEAYITKNKGEIKVSTLDEIHNITLDNKIKIYNLELNSDDKYTLGVNLNEEIK